VLHLHGKNQKKSTKLHIFSRTAGVSGERALGEGAGEKIIRNEQSGLTLAEKGAGRSQPSPERRVFLVLRGGERKGRRRSAFSVNVPLGPHKQKRESDFITIVRPLRGGEKGTVNPERRRRRHAWYRQQGTPEKLRKVSWGGAAQTLFGRELKEVLLEKRCGEERGKQAHHTWG